MSQQIKLPLGSVDAVIGTLKMHVPMGPRLPGRIPLGFTWAYDSHDSQMALKGGSLRPVVWPGGSSSPLQVTVVVNGEPWAFYKQAKPATGYDNATLLKWGGDRGVPTAGAEGTTTGVCCFPNTDGTRFFVTYSLINELGRTTIVRAVLTGDMAIWTAGSPDAPVANPVTHFTNRWGDHVTVNETVGTGSYGAPQTILIRNEKYTGHTITLDIQGLAAYFANSSSPGNVTATITNSLMGSDNVALPTVVLTGAFSANQRVNKAYQVGQVGYYTGIYDGMVTPNNITENVIRTTSFNWLNGRLNNVNLPSGLVETFYYGDGMNDLDRSTSWDKTSGKWIGFENQPRMVGSDPYEWVVGPVDRVDLSGGGVGQCITFGRVRDKYSIPTYTTLDNITTVLTYPSTTPGGDFRGMRFTHPSGWDGVVGDASPRAYLFAASTVIAAEKIHGNGSLDAWGRLSGTATVDATTLYDGWDLRCWSNPTGGLANGLPVNAVALRTRSYTPGLPTKTVIAGTRDAWGPTQTDEYTDQESAPSFDATASPIWSDALSLPTGAVHRQGTIHRPQTLDPVSMSIPTNDDTKTLTLNATSASRYTLGVDGTLTPVTSVGFGTTTNTYTNGLLTMVTGTRGSSVSVERRDYLPGQPLVSETTKTLTGNPRLGTPSFSGQVGMTYGYDATSFHWLTSETDKLTARATTYLLRDDLGRPLQVKDANGIVATTTYDAWGRVYTVEKGGVKTTYTYDSNGLWAETKVEGASKTLVTHTDFDSLGRVTKVIYPDGSTQQTGYNGYGQKIRQTPLLRPGTDSYGDFTWEYDGQGRLVSTRDRSFGPGTGRLLTEVVRQPSWATLKGIPAVWTTIRAYRSAGKSFDRSEGHDLLGQKVAVIDQRASIDATRPPATYSYDADGHLLQTNQGGQTRSYHYDPDMGWLLSRTEPEEGTTSYGNFTILGMPQYSHMTGRNNQSNVETITTLDARSRPSRIDVKSAGTTVTSRQLTYRDDYNAVTALTETQPNGSITENYDYDNLARLNFKSITDGNQSFKISRVLDALGNTVSQSYPDGGGRLSQTVTTQFDTSNRVKTVNLDNVLRGQMGYGAGSGFGWTDTLTHANGVTTDSKMDQGDLVSSIHKVMSGLSGNQQVNQMSWTQDGLLASRGPNANPQDSANDQFDYDELQRLSHSRTLGLNNEVAEQWFSYDLWGNRTQSDYIYTVNGGMPKPDELMAWTATYDGGNRLPLQVNGLIPGSTLGLTMQGSISGALVAGAAYDDLGRVTGVNAIPGNAASQTNYGYDPSGRVTSEIVNGVTTTFLLDGEGLRFKRMRADGWLEYTVYGFSREPLAQFEKTPAMVIAAQSLAAKTTLTGKKGKVQPTIIVREPAGASITSPAGPITVTTGQSILFKGETGGTTLAWNFGDGATASGVSVTHAFASPGIFTVTLTCSGTGLTTSTTSVSITVVSPPPVITNFASNVSTIPSGAGATLSWSVTNATSVTLSGGAVAASGGQVVYPTSTTTYTLSAGNSGGTVNSQVTVTVVQPPVISAFSASPANIYQGDGSILAWSVSGATSLALDQGIGSVTGSSSRSVSPSATTNYTLTATNTLNGVSVSRTAGTTVTVSPRPTVPSIISFTVDASAIAAGSGTTLRWSVSNSVGAVNVAISNVGAVASSGTQWVAPTSTLTYTLTATNTLDPTKSVSKDVLVTVVNKPLITFSASTSTINVGGSSTLSWSVANGVSIAIDQGVGTVGASGSQNVSPGATITYTLTASNLAGTSTAAVTIYVTQKPVIVSFSASSTQITQGGSATLSWSTQGATSLTVNGMLVSGTSLQVAPSKTTTYTLVATNSAGSDSRAITITVMTQETYLWKKTLVYGFGTLICEEKPTGTFFVQGDQVGSPSIITDASGAVVGRSKNMPFGERFGQTGEKAFRRFTNHEDQDGSAIYMQARTYLAAYGKFAQVDPAYDQTKDDPETWNLYNYVTNNPVTHTDPDGRMSLGNSQPDATWQPNQDMSGAMYWDYSDADRRLLLNALAEAANQKTDTTPLTLQGGTGAVEGRAPSARTDQGGGFWSSLKALFGFGDKKPTQTTETTTAELFARPTDPKARMGHAFWVIKGTDGKYYEVTGGYDNGTPSKVHGDVVVCNSREDAIQKGLCGFDAKTLSKLGTFNVDAKYGTLSGLNAVRDQFNSTLGKRDYRWTGPNSNTYANWFGRQMDIRMSTNPQNHSYPLIGWNWTP